MRKWLFVASFAVAVCAEDLTLEQILEKNQEALGGAEAIRGVQTLKMTAKMTVAGAEMPMVTMIRRPNLVRTEVVFQGQTVITAYDGSSAWTVSPLLGPAEPRKMDEKMSASLASSDLDSSIGALAALKGAGHSVELVGKEEVNGNAAYKVRLIRNKGSSTVYLLDAATFLPVKVVATLPQMGQELEVESFPSNFVREGKIMLARQIESKVQGRVAMQIVIEKVELNLPMEDSLFAMPAAGAEGPK